MCAQMGEKTWPIHLLQQERLKSPKFVFACICSGIWKQNAAAKFIFANAKVLFAGFYLPEIVKCAVE